MSAGPCTFSETCAIGFLRYSTSNIRGAITKQGLMSTNIEHIKAFSYQEWQFPNLEVELFGGC